MGNYITIECQDVNIAEASDYELTCKAISSEISKLFLLNDKSSILVVGLGNSNITPDALGPKVISKLMITRHLIEYVPEQIDKGIRAVCAISPGVLGTTGMETGEIIKSVVDRIKPDLVIVIDALASRSICIISNTIQICDTGISPGSGVGNKRKALDKSSLGVKVIAIGVPTVVDAKTITVDILEQAAKAGGEKNNLLESVLQTDKDSMYNTLREKLSSESESFMVTPKEIDILIDRISKVIADGINLTLHKNLEIDDIKAYVS